jgi:hypothetical protein
METIETTCKPAALMGRLASGQELGAGVRVHAVPGTTQHYGHGKALCGAEPGRRSGGWDVEFYAGKPVTCPRCVKKVRATAQP